MHVPVDVKNSTMAFGKGRAPRMASRRFVHVTEDASVSVDLGLLPLR